MNGSANETTKYERKRSLSEPSTVNVDNAAEDSPAMRMSLWLRPGGDALAMLQSAIKECGGSFGGEKPKPHVSLLGNIVSTVPAAQALLAQFAALADVPMVELADFDHRKGEYYRCWFLKAEPVTTLKKLQIVAETLFGVVSTEPFEPHLSLAYGAFEGALGQQLSGEFASLNGLRFMPVSIDLVAASGDLPVADWAMLASVPVVPQKPFMPSTNEFNEPGMTGVIP